MLGAFLRIGQQGSAKARVLFGACAAARGAGKRHGRCDPAVQRDQPLGCGADERGVAVLKREERAGRVRGTESTQDRRNVWRHERMLLGARDDDLLQRRGAIAQLPNDAVDELDPHLARDWQRRRAPGQLRPFSAADRALVGSQPRSAVGNGEHALGQDEPRGWEATPEGSRFTQWVEAEAAQQARGSDRLDLRIAQEVAPGARDRSETVGGVIGL